MGLTASDTGSSRKPAPIGTHLAYCYQVIDLGTQTSTFDGEKKTAHKVWLGFELTEEKGDDGKPVTVGTFSSVSLHEKATLRKWLEAWRTRAFTADELKGFKLTNILGKSCMVTVTHKQKANGGISDVVASVTAPPKGVQPSGPMNNTPTTLDLDADKFNKAVYEALPKFLQDVIYRSPEGLKVVAPGQPSGQNTTGTTTGEAYSDEGIPF